jgi:hypothetical protein
MNKNKCETPLQSVFIINVLFTVKAVMLVGWWNHGIMMTLAQPATNCNTRFFECKLEYGLVVTTY